MTGFYTEWFSFYLNIPSKFEPLLYLKASSNKKKRILKQKIVIGMFLVLYCTKHHFSNISARCLHKTKY